MEERRIYRGTFGQILVPKVEDLKDITPRSVSGREQKITGVNGCIKWHYFTAAGVKSYTVIRDVQGNWSMTCFVVNPDAYKMTQKPLRFVAAVGTGEWVWLIDTIDVRTGGAATAKLWPPLS